MSKKLINPEQLAFFFYDDAKHQADLLRSYVARDVERSIRRKLTEQLTQLIEETVERSVNRGLASLQRELQNLNRAVTPLQRDFQKLIKNLEKMRTDEDAANWWKEERAPDPDPDDEVPF